MSDNIKVVVKLRPLITREIEEKLSYQWRVKENTLYQLDSSGKDTGASFTFDKVYDTKTHTTSIYNDIAKPIVEAAVTGINGTIFAYGQTSSGKTYTMTGTDETPGIIPMAVQDLFDIIDEKKDRDFLIRASYIEIYNETVIDLLNPSNKNVKIYNTIYGVKIEVEERVTTNPDEVLAIMVEGERNRHIGATNMNERSSRSHTIFQITIESRDHSDGGEDDVGCVNVSQLNLVDLAGSERAHQAAADNLRFKEGTHINLSLSQLGLVIKQLSEIPRPKFINYRDSKLTRILQNSLGGNAKTSIICAVTPAALEETSSTLQFANRAKSIQNKPEVNAVATADDTMIQKLTKKLTKLQAELVAKKTVEQDNQVLLKKIKKLQCQILNGISLQSVMDVSNSRRKTWCAPRRQTISTLHVIPENSSSDHMPRFCTPALKYNPLTLGVQELSAAKERPNLSIDTSRITTPTVVPGKKVNFGGEVIEIDSDDEDDKNNTETKEPCSPMHVKCHDSSKTPPCELRKRVKKYEQEYNEIVEMTELEKLYPPKIVELTQKLTECTTKITSLEDICEEKDVKIKDLNNIISKTEIEIKDILKSKEDLESKCNEYHMKLTDVEVSYETLKKKKEMREQELLSLLDDKKRSSSSFGKVVDNELSNLMDFEMSLVNSDSESIINSNDDNSTQIHNIVTDIQTQLSSKNIVLIEKDTEIQELKLKIETLTNINLKSQEQITTLEEKNNGLQLQIKILQEKVNALTETVQNQQECLDSANNDIKSYNDIIQDLRLALSRKNNIPNLNESDVETMIANEETFLANNENMNNIIINLKNIINSKNKEINDLKVQKEEENLKLIEYEQEVNSKLIEKTGKYLNELNLLKLSNENLLLCKTELEQNLNSAENQAKDITQKFIKYEGQIEVLNKSLLEVKSQNDELAVEITNFKQQKQDFKSELDKIKNLNESLLETNKQLLCEIKIIKEENIQLNSNLKEKESEKESFAQENCKLNLEITKITEEYEGIKIEIINKQAIEEEMSSRIQDLLKQIDALTIKISALERDIQQKQNIILNLNQDNQTNKILNKIKIVGNRIQGLLDIITHCKHKSIPDNILDSDIIFQSLDDFVDSLEFALTEIDAEKESVLNKNANLIKELQSINIKFQKELTDASPRKAENMHCELDVLKSNFKHYEKEIEVKDTCISQLTLKMTETIETNKKLQKEISEKDKILKSLELNEADLNSVIENLKDSLLKREEELLTEIMQQEEAYTSKLLTLKKTVENKNEEIIALNNKVLLYANEYSNANVLLEKRLQDAHSEISKLVVENLELLKKSTRLNSNLQQVTTDVSRIEQGNINCIENLKECNKLIENLHKELETKIEELNLVEKKIKKYNDEILVSQRSMELKIQDLQNENAQLKECFKEQSPNSDNFSLTTFNYDKNVKIQEKLSPPSLLNICCTKLSDILITPDSRCNNLKLLKSCDSQGVQVKICEEENTNKTEICKLKFTKYCDSQGFKVNISEEENSDETEICRLNRTIQFLRTQNKDLTEELENVRKEFKLLFDPILELEKKAFNHRAHLSTLTMTTYAETKLLRSQVKVLNYLNSKQMNIYHKDLPALKRQLHTLLAILRTDPVLANAKLTPNIKRFSLPDALEENIAINALTNNSTLDSDWLMLDNNITLSNNTLDYQDQTSLDVNQLFIDELGEKVDEIASSIPIVVQNYQQDLVNQLYELKKENEDLKEKNKNHYSVTSAEKSHNEIETTSSCKNCLDKHLILKDLERITDENTKLEIIIKQKLSQSQDNTESKLKSLEEKLVQKSEENKKVLEMLHKKSDDVKILQQENDSLSNEIMDRVLEIDELKTKYDSIKAIQTEKNVCSVCKAKSEAIKGFNIDGSRTPSKSQRDSHHKLNSLQYELDASKEDSKKIAEEVATIKNHLERSNLSLVHNMDLDVSMEERNIFNLTKGLHSPQTIPLSSTVEKKATITFDTEKIDCLNFFIEKTGIDKENLNRDLNFYEMIKMLYNNLVAKHGEEIENLYNKLRDLEKSKIELTNQLCGFKSENAKIHNLLLSQTNFVEHTNHFITNFKKSLENLSENTNETSLCGNLIQVTNDFKDNFLGMVDSQFSTNTKSVFEGLVNSITHKYEFDLNSFQKQYNESQRHIEKLTEGLKCVSDQLKEMTDKFKAKEQEYNILQRQKDKVNEISNAVTLNIVKKEKELCEAITEGLNKLLLYNIMQPEDIDLTNPINENLTVIFDRLIDQTEKNLRSIQIEKEQLQLQIKKSEDLIIEKENDLKVLQEENNKLTVINDSISQLKHTNSELNQNNNKLSLEIVQLKQDIDDKNHRIESLENEIVTLKTKSVDTAKICENLEKLQSELTQLKAAKETICREKENSIIELKKCAEIISANTKQIENMDREIHKLNKSVLDKQAFIEKLRSECQADSGSKDQLIMELSRVEKLYKEKCEDYDRISNNIKTHENTARIQANIVNRLKSEIEATKSTLQERNQYIDELKNQCTKFQKECDTLKGNLKSSEERIEELSKRQNNLKLQTMDLEMSNEPRKSRTSLDKVGDGSRRRRQSIYDSRRMFDDGDFDNNKGEAVFASRCKPDDLFFNAEDVDSSRSTPTMPNRRESLLSNKSGEREHESPPARASSVNAARLRRQSIHDQHRTALVSTSPRESLNPALRGDAGDVSEISNLRTQLTLCQQELNDLKEQYRELDEECEICSQYLRERDEQCVRLNKEKIQLEEVAKDLQQKLDSFNSKKNTIDVSINTDEDWSNLHSVVVDRMSFDVEVEKNKKLTKAVEELRYKNHELKNTIGKMQRAIEKYANRDQTGLQKELSSTKEELKHYKQQVQDLEQKYRELDEECETCSQYLREKEEQCKKLFQAKQLLEEKLLELEPSAPSTRQKRRSLHDQNRLQTQVMVDATTEICDDLLSSQAERDENLKLKEHLDEIKLLTKNVEELSRQKLDLEKQLSTASYVSTGSGIVKDQQLSDLLKENYKLKKMNTKLVNYCKKRKDPNLGKETEAQED